VEAQLERITVARSVITIMSSVKVFPFARPNGGRSSEGAKQMHAERVFTTQQSRDKPVGSDTGL
jgi:hypothetical protein